MKKRTILLIALGALIGICICIAIFAAYPSPSLNATATARVIATQSAPTATLAPIPTTVKQAAQSTSVSQPTSAPVATIAKPTNTAVPVATATVPALAKIGDMVQSGGIAFGVASVQKSNGPTFVQPKAGNTFLVVEAVIQNITRDTTPYNPFYLKVKDADGFEYTMAGSYIDPALKSGDLVKGDKVRGMVTFEVPLTAKGFVVTYQPIVILGGYVPIKVDLGL